MDDGIQLFAGPAKRKKTSTAASEAAVKRRKHDGSTSSAVMPNKSSSIHPADASTSTRHDGDVSAAQQQATLKKPAQHTAEATAVENNDERGAADATEAGAAAPSELPQAADFKSLGLTEWLCNVCSSLGMQKPTQVQSGCIPAILQGKDVIGTAQTGSGKTAAFALPILQQLAKDPFGVFALVLTPTRELAVQISDQFKALGAGMSLRECVVIGGMEQQQQARELMRRPHVVIATPGRLASLLASDSGLAKGFSRTRFLVLDEADRVLDSSFQEALRGILGALPGSRQTLLFSATMTQALVKLQQEALRDAFTFQAYEGLRTADQLKEQYVFIPAKVKEVYLYHLLQQLQSLRVRSSIIFCSTCKGCHLLALLLEQLGLPAAALHSGKSQKQRLAALSSFKSEMVPLLLATDVASRGLDIPTVDLVINYDLPLLARDYVHRVGRTARAGRSGWSLSLITQYDVELVHQIEGLIGHQLQEYTLPEAEVLKGITRVYSAKRAALMAAAEEEGGVFSKSLQKREARRQRKEAAAAAGGKP